MSIQSIKSIVESNSKKILGGIISIVIMAGVIGYSSNQEKNDDMLSLLLEIDPEDMFDADFFTEDLLPYTGPISSTVEGCLRNSSDSAGRGSVYATVDLEEFGKMVQEKEDGSLDTKMVRDDIIPVLGHAMFNNQINWEWNEDALQYEFFVSPDEEPLWQCYFESQDTFFFQRFFDHVWFDYKTPNYSSAEIERI